MDRRGEKGGGDTLCFKKCNPVFTGELKNEYVFRKPLLDSIRVSEGQKKSI